MGVVLKKFQTPITIILLKPTIFRAASAPPLLHCMLIYNARQYVFVKFRPARKLFGQELKLLPIATDKVTHGLRCF